LVVGHDPASAEDFCGPLKQLKCLICLSKMHVPSTKFALNDGAAESGIELFEDRRRFLTAWNRLGVFPAVH